LEETLLRLEGAFCLSFPVTPKEMQPNKALQLTPSRYASLSPRRFYVTPNASSNRQRLIGVAELSVRQHQ